MAYFFQPSLSGLLLQAMGALLMASLCIVLWRTVRRRPLMFWSAGWFTLFLSLVSLWFAFYFARFQHIGQALYLFGEYIFGYLVIAGCRNYATGESPQRRDAWLLLPLLVLSIALALFTEDNVNVFFAIHTLIYPYLFFTALRVLRGVPPGPNAVIGLRVTKLALLILTIDYLHYAPFFAASSYRNLSVIDAYLTYAPLYDLMPQVMLMFGMVMLVTGQVQRELESANTDLQAARDRIELISRVDPLTSALNRRAFAAAVQEMRSRAGASAHGVVVVADLDDLKSLNDRHGHAAGDEALRVLTGALRSCMTGTDLLFRWGGDEFVLLLEGATLAAAEARFDGFDAKLRQVAILGVETAVDLRASVGLEAFADLADLDPAMERADQAMYRRKATA